METDQVGPLAIAVETLHSKVLLLEALVVILSVNLTERQLAAAKRALARVATEYTPFAALASVLPPEFAELGRANNMASLAQGYQSLLDAGTEPDPPKPSLRIVD